MRYIRKSDLDEKRLKQEFKEEFIFSQKAIEVKRKFQISTKDLAGASLTNLYHITRRYEYVYFSNLVRKMLQDKVNVSVLDVGCGTCYVPFSFSKLTERYVGIDLYNLSKFYTELTNNVDFKRHDITKAPLQDANFDLAICISVLEHIPVELRIKAFENIVSSLKPGGVFAFTFDVDLEGNGEGFTFDEVAETILHLQELGLDSCEEIDLTTYDDLLTTEIATGLPQNRYQLPWRISKFKHNLFNRILTKIGIIKPKLNSIAVVRGSFQKK